MSETSPLIVDTAEGYTDGILTTLKEYALPIGLVIVLIIVYFCYKEPFASPDGVVARRS